MGAINITDDSSCVPGFAGNPPGIVVRRLRPVAEGADIVRVHGVKR